METKIITAPKDTWVYIGKKHSAEVLYFIENELYLGTNESEADDERV